MFEMLAEIPIDSNKAWGRWEVWETIIKVLSVEMWLKFVMQMVGEQLGKWN